MLRHRWQFILRSILNGSSHIPLPRLCESVRLIADAPLQRLLVSLGDKSIFVVRVIGQGGIGREEVSQCIDVESLQSKHGVYDVAGRFGHFRLVHCPMAMSKNVLRQWQIKR